MGVSSSLPSLVASAASQMDPDKWAIYKKVLVRARERGVCFAVGGGLATMVYSGQPRKSKDLDLFVLTSDREELIRIVVEAGMHDLYDEQPYDRAWIFRGTANGAILDVIWAMANQRTPVDRDWVDRGPEVITDDVSFRLVPGEETLWSKLYILQRDRCDWPDGLNLLYTLAPDLDWRHLFTRLGEDAPLLAGLLSVFKWSCPERARDVPAWVWTQLDLRPPTFSSCPDLVMRRANLLDTRPWFTPTIEGIQELINVNRNNESSRAQHSGRNSLDGGSRNGVY